MDFWQLACCLNLAEVMKRYTSYAAGAHPAKDNLPASQSPFPATGDKMGRVEDGLNHPLEFVEPYLVDDKGQDDGDGEAPQQAVEADEHRVLHHPPEGGRLEEPGEPVEAHPPAGREAQVGIEVPEAVMKCKEEFHEFFIKRYVLV